MKSYSTRPRIYCAIIPHNAPGEEATAIKTFFKKILIKTKIFSFFFPSISALIVFVKQHNGGFVPAIWSTVNYSWPVDAMPTTASKRITLCWRIMDIYSSGILFTIFCKIDVCTKVMWWTLVHILSFKITKGDERHYSLLRHVKDGILWKKKKRT